MTDGNGRGGIGSVLRVQAVLVAIALVAGLTIATVHEWTRPMVMEQRGGLFGDAALEVLPDAVNYRIYTRGADGRPRLLGDGDSPELFIGLDARGRTVGAAIVGSGMGYADVIQLVFGLDLIAGRLTGMRVVASRETPGLGSVIVDDMDWVDSFGRIELQFDGQRQLQPLRVRDGARHEQGEVDAISGATVSVYAVTQIINRSLAEWLPILREEFAELTGGRRE
ncbi:MAG: FMN-binding protein [Gammaproteobacteria bacterium]|nr:FMN-binding protein [Gammaproteobacteria bacterium]